MLIREVLLARAVTIVLFFGMAIPSSYLPYRAESIGEQATKQLLRFISLWLCARLHLHRPHKTSMNFFFTRTDRYGDGWIDKLYRVIKSLALSLQARDYLACVNYLVSQALLHPLLKIHLSNISAFACYTRSFYS
ncbi:hypothetical protein BX667DRAFT_327063 [Coemansia mojavensis]|nr:hypothetical protein BX667DRAFT_327063 [Coemansia mojavensis]